MPARTHGMSKTPLYGVWCQMRNRCYRRKTNVFKYYGGRGIRVCQAWRDSFGAFLADMGPTYRHGLVLDRRDNDGNYEPTNCRWVTRLESMRNMGPRALLTYCRKGHLFTPDNEKIVNGRRTCRACVRARDIKYGQIKRGEMQCPRLSR